MSDLLIKDFSAPSKCMECEWRDAEACGMCELMIDNPFLTFSEQYAHCPFQMIAKRHPLVPVPPHGRLIDADAAIANRNKDTNWCYDLYDLPEYLSDCPTIIPAEEGEA